MKKVPVLLTTVVIFLLFANVSAQPNKLNPVNPKHESAVATLKTFYNAFQQPRVGVTPDPLEEAVKCLDLREIPDEFQSVKGLEVAVDIKEILDLVENFQIEDAPNDPNAEPFTVYRSTKGEIVLARQENGDWLFTKETVHSIPVLVSAVEEERAKNGISTLTQQESIGAQIRDRMPNVLKQRTFFFERWQWLGLIVLLVLGVIIGRIVRSIADFTIGKYLQKRYPSFSGEQIANIYSPIGLLAFLITFRFGLRALALTQSTLTSFRTVMFILTAIAIIWLLYRIIDAVAYFLRQRSMDSDSQVDDLLVPFVSAIIRIAVVIIGAIVVAENLQYDVTGLIAGLGIGGIAIALAAQETISNFFGSLVVLIEQPFRADDRVEIENVKGIVKEIGLRSTKIFTDDDSLITLPNSTVAKAAILNDQINRQRRWILKLNIQYQEFTKIDKFTDGVKEILANDKNFDKQPFKVHLFELTAPSIIIRIEVFFNQDNWTFELDARNHLISELLKLADKLDVKLEIPN
ncbi:MAG: mechanosensitive ion channel family protein [Pyrinomonadaceae bacterium]|nr:mechanosensitive ion channel family protein [Pyrinomonadaceae bacterium]